MTEKEYMLTRDLGNWLVYVEGSLEMPEDEATVLWYNEHNKGKKLICESRGVKDDKPGTRMFIRNVTNSFEDSMKREGWWNTFTLCRDKVEKGLYIVEVVRYRLDKSGNLNCEVKIVKQITDEMYTALFVNSSGYRNSATWLMLTASQAFVTEYTFSVDTLKRAPNFKELKKRFPVFEGLTEVEIGEKALNMFISGELSVEEIKECLDRPSEFEQLCYDIAEALHDRKVDKLYSDKYPLFAKKVDLNAAIGASEHWTAIRVREYLNRQLDYYYELLDAEKIQPVDGSFLDKVEASLVYRKQLKDAEKAEKNRQRKMKKAAQLA